MADNHNDDTAAKKRVLAEAIANNELTLGEAVQRMRKISGMSQKAYAKQVVGISPRILAEIERGVGNPTVETLNKIGRPFGYTIGFVAQRGPLAHRRMS